MAKKIIDRVCENPWCKVPFKLEVDEDKNTTVKAEDVEPENLNDSIDSLIKEIKKDRRAEEENKKNELPRKCPKCQNLDYEVDWQDKKYEGERWDGKPHPVGFKFRQFRNGKWQ